MHRSTNPCFEVCHLHSQHKEDSLIIESTMLLPHMLVNTSTAVLRKCVHADPTYMGPATNTHHMITPTSLLEVSMTFRTRFNAILLPPSAKGVMAALQVVTVFGAGQTFVEFNMACAANPIQAGRALQRCILLRRSVYDFAVWCRTVMELGRTGVDVR